MPQPKLEITIVDLRTLPTPLPPETIPATISMGDGQGNVLRYLQHGIVNNLFTLSPAAYSAMVNIYYKKEPLTAKDFADFKELLKTAVISPLAYEKLVVYIGDNFGDRGTNDGLTLLFFEFLHEKEIRFLIPLSNHDYEFILACENEFDQKKYQYILERNEHRASLIALEKSISSGHFSKQAVLDIYHSVIKPALVPFYCELTAEGGVVIYSHSPFHLGVIQAYAQKYNINNAHTNLATALDIKIVSDQIRLAYLPTILNGQISNSCKKEILRKGYEGGYLNLSFAFKNFTWDEFQIILNLPVTKVAAFKTGQQDCSDSSDLRLNLRQQKQTDYTELALLDVQIEYLRTKLVENERTDLANKLDTTLAFPVEYSMWNRCLRHIDLQNNIREFPITNIFGHVGPDWIALIDKPRLADGTQINAKYPNQFYLNLDASNLGKMGIYSSRSGDKLTLANLPTLEGEAYYLQGELISGMSYPKPQRECALVSLQALRDKGKYNETLLQTLANYKAVYVMTNLTLDSVFAEINFHLKNTPRFDPTFTTLRTSLLCHNSQVKILMGADFLYPDFALGERYKVLEVDQFISQSMQLLQLQPQQKIFTDLREKFKTILRASISDAEIAALEKHVDDLNKRIAQLKASICVQYTKENQFNLEAWASQETGATKFNTSYYKELLASFNFTLSRLQTNHFHIDVYCTPHTIGRLESIEATQVRWFSVIPDDIDPAVLLGRLETAGVTANDADSEVAAISEAGPAIDDNDVQKVTLAHQKMANRKAPLSPLLWLLTSQKIAFDDGLKEDGQMPANNFFTEMLQIRQQPPQLAAAVPDLKSTDDLYGNDTEDPALRSG